MVPEIACCSIRITVCLLLVCTTLGSAQSGKRRPQDSRGVTVVPEGGTSASPSTAFSSSIYRQSWAVVVGVNHFRHPGIPALNYAVNDARAIAQALEPLGFPRQHIIMLLDAQATKGEVERLLRSVMSRTTEAEDRLLIFFATHGTTAALPGGGEEGYLLLHDSDPTDVGFTALSMRDLKQMGQLIRAKHILVAVDACYGGYTLVRAQVPPRVDPGYLALLARSRVIQVLTAGKKDQLVSEERDHGVFTRKLLEGLQGHADTNGDGIITGTELAAWMHPRVAQASENKQDMQFGNLDGEGQFFFIVSQAVPGVPSKDIQEPVGIDLQQPPKHPAYDQNTNYNKGVKNMNGGRYEQAINDFRQVIMGNPNHTLVPQAYYNRGVCYMHTGQKDKAIDDLKKFLELSNDPDLRQKAEYNLNRLVR